MIGLGIGFALSAGLLATVEVPRTIDLRDVLFWCGMVFIALRFEAELEDIILSPIDVVAVMAVFILPPALAALVVAVFAISSEIWRNPHFRWVTEISNHLMYGICTALVGWLYVSVYTVTPFEVTSTTGLFVAFGGMAVFYLANLLIMAGIVAWVKNMYLVQYIVANSGGFPLYNTILAPLAYLGVVMYLQSPLGGWGGWTVVVMLVPIFYAQYLFASQSRRLRQTSQQLTQSEGQLHSLLDSLPVGVYRVERDGQLLTVNQAMAQIFGYDRPEEMIGLNTEHLFANTDDRARLLQQWQASDAVSINDILLIRRDGKYIWGRDTVRVTYGTDGNILYLDGSLEDITERKLIELELNVTNQLVRQAKQEWEATVDSLPNFIALLNGNKRIIRSNRKIQDWGIHDLGSINGLLLLELMSDCTRVDVSASINDTLQTAWDALHNNRSYQFEIHHAQTSRQFLVGLHPLHEATYSDTLTRDSFAVMVVQDVTEARQMEQTMRDLNTELEARVIERTTQLEDLNIELKRALQKEKELNAFRSRFGTMISHEFRTPLTVIQTSADLIRRYGEKNQITKFQELPDRIRHQVHHLVNLLDDIMTISKAETVGLELNHKRVDLQSFGHELREEVVQIVRPGQKFRLDLDDLQGIAQVNEKMIYQMIRNLVSNAAKYSAHDGTITLYMAANETTLTLKVQDDGIGIPRAALPHLFEPFYRAENVGMISGTGLGLAIVKLSVDLHRGTINVQSDPGQGTTFDIQLPVVVEQV